MPALLWVVVSLALLVSPVSAQFVAEQINAGNAATDLFGGSDADGGIEDWYMTNGVVQAIIDDVGVQADLVPLVGPLAPPKTSEAAFTGGSIVDLGLAGANNDQVAQMFTVGGLSTSNFILYSAISASTTPTSATITCTGNLLGFDSGATPVPPANLPVVTEYTLNGSDPFVNITTTVTNTHPTNRAMKLGGFLDVFVWTQRGLVPFSPIAGRGFTHAAIDLSNPNFALEFPPYAAAPGNIYPADGVMDPTSGGTVDEVAYGMLGEETSLDQDGPGGSPPVVAPVNSLFGLSGNLLTGLGNPVVTNPLTGGLDAGGILIYKRRIYVGNKNDVAAVANPMITELATRQAFSTGTISGNVDAADTTDVRASIIATKTAGAITPGFGNGTPATQFRTASDGTFSGVVLPVGTYDLEVRAPERDTVTVTGVVVSASSNTPVTVPSLSAQGTVTLTVRELVMGEDPMIPAKVTFKGIRGTPDPVFAKDYEALVIPQVGSPSDIQPETYAGGNAQRNFVYLASGTGSVKVRPGVYEIYASRGPEYTVKRRLVRVKPGGTRTSKLNIRKVVYTTGYLSADFHIHSARSLDASAPLRDRVGAFVGEGVHVMVSTDHDYHVDYAPIISSLGVGSLITSIVGNEVTTSTPNPPAFPDAIGHINAWPVPVQPTTRRDGSIEDEFVAPNWIYSRLRSQGAEVIQYNHPRAGLSGLTVIGFFNNIGYDPDLPITAVPNDILLDDDVLGQGMSGVANPDGYRNIDFDVMEVGNGSEIPYATRRDWLSLLNQTDFNTVPFLPGTGVSDSHRVTMESAGYYRTYVGGQDDPATLDVSNFNTNLKNGNAFATTGPFVSFWVEESGGGRARLGQVLAPATSDVTLHITVQASNWIPVDEVRVIANGFTTLTFDTTTTPAVSRNPSVLSPSPRPVVRFDAAIPVTVTADTYFIVEAGQKLSPPPTSPAFAGMLVPGFVSHAFTNPIFVDLLGDGFDPPGLPVMVSATGAGEERPMFARVERRDLTWLAQAGEWLNTQFAAVNRIGAAEACRGEAGGLTGRSLTDAIKLRKGRPTDEYFPLYRFSIPADAVAKALDTRDAASRTQARAVGQRGGGA